MSTIGKTLLFAAVILFSAPMAQADYPSGYYNSLEGKNKGALKTAAHDVIAAHTRISYGDNGTWRAFRTTDVRTIDGVDYWWDMYSNNKVRISSGHSGLNIEHSVANSWWDGTKNDAYCDIHHLNPSDKDANSRKGNYPLAVVGTVTWTNGVTTVGKPKGDAGGATMVYEPCDEYKGDFARVFFYMFTCYEDMKWGTRFTWMYNQGQTYPMLKPWAYELLLQWSRQDPVSEKERNRNEAVYAVQHNRNPFIDLPELAEYIWGNRQNEAFSLSGNPSTPELLNPKDGEVVNFGNRRLGMKGTSAITVSGRNLTGPLTLTLTGSDHFSISPTTITAAEAAKGTPVNIYYDAAEIGSHSGQLTISGGGLEYAVRLTLTGSTVENSKLQPLVALDPDNVTQTGYRAQWQPADVTPDYYIVNRTYKVNGAMKTRRFMTTTPYYDFTDRDFGSDEIYTVQYAVADEVSPVSNEISLRAGSLGVAIPDADDFEVMSVPGGLRITNGAIDGFVTVYDVSGRAVVTVQGVAGGDFIPLAKGIYILSASRLRTPLKFMVP